MIGKIAVVFHTILAVIVGIDVYKELKQYSNNVSPGNLPNSDHDGPKLRR